MSTLEITAESPGGAAKNTMSTSHDAEDRHGGGRGHMVPTECVCGSRYGQVHASAFMRVSVYVCVCMCASMYLVPCVARLSRCCHQGLRHIYWGYVYIEHMEDKSHTRLEEKYKLIPIRAKNTTFFANAGFKVCFFYPASPAHTDLYV